MMLNVDARGDACPLPVVKAKKAIAALNGAGEVEVLVDNEIAVQNLTKMAQQKGYGSSAEKLAEREYCVRFTVGDASAAAEEPAVCTPDARTDTVVAIAADTMGEGAEELGRTLLKAFVFGLVIVCVSCHQGFATTEGAVGVGRATRRTVIVSFLLILMLGYFVTRLFYQ